jgi:hypothetical protein
MQFPAPQAAADNSGDDPAAFKGVVEVGAATGAIASLGGVAGLVLAAFAKTLYPNADIEYGDWIGYSAALAGLFALVVEVTHRAS